MADYFAPTVIQPTIPAADITALERLLLSHIFNAEPDGEDLYFYADERPADMIWLDRTQLDAALARSPTATDSAATAFVTEQLARVPAGNVEIELDLRAAGNSSSRTSCAAQEVSATSRRSRPLPARRCGPTVSAAWLSSSRPLPSWASPPAISSRTS
jgi:hypothetical protein